MKNSTTLILAAGFVVFIGLGCGSISAPLINEYQQRGCQIAGKPEPKTSEDFVERAHDHIEIYSGGGAASLDDCAFAALNEALRLDSDNVDALCVRGYGYKQRKQYESALADYDKAIRIEPDNEDNYAARRFLFEAWGKFDRAIEDQTTLLNFQLKKNLADDEKIIEKYEERIELYRKKGAYESAIKDYTEIIRIKPSGFAFSNRAGAFAEKGDFENAIKDYTEAIRLAPEEANFYYLRAEVYYKMGRSDLAGADARKGDELRAGEKTENTSLSKTISGGVLNGKATNLVQPTYPAAARAVHATGAVNVQVTVNENGDVISATAVSGHPLLRAAAAQAARALKFPPARQSGQLVQVTGVIVYNFTLD